MSCEPKITYRGWPGHFICSRDCIFRLNTLIEMEGVWVVVSTVGNLQPASSPSRKIEKVGSGYYETMVFFARQDKDGYWDADTTKAVALAGKVTVSKLSSRSDQEAQEMHEAAVQEIIARMRNGKLAGG